MNEVNNRKVLISIKVSTILLILLGIISVVVIGNIVKNKLLVYQSGKLKTTVSIQNNNLQGNVTQEQIEEPVIQAQISSRALESPRAMSEQFELNNIDIIQKSELELEETDIEPEQLQMSTTSIEEVTISLDMDLTVRTGLSKDDFIELISGVKEDTSNFFEENAGLIYDVCEKYELNEIFFCGLISAESGWTIAKNHRNTYNYISLMSSNGGLIKFSSVEDGIEKAAQSLHNNYLIPGGRFYHGSTLAGVKTKFCPASSTWVNLVYQRMQQILK